MGLHAACCGPNTWVVTQASGQVFINGSNMVRIGDKTMHCGITQGKMITGSAVVVDGSGMFSSVFSAPMAITVMGPPLEPELSDEQRAALPCDHPLYRPPGGEPERPEAGPIRNPEAIEEDRERRLDAAERLGFDVSAERDADYNAALRDLMDAEEALQNVGEAGAETIKRARENRDRARQHFETVSAARGGRGGANVRRTPRR
jgi:hypothetical protein